MNDILQRPVSNRQSIFFSINCKDLVSQIDFGNKYDYIPLIAFKTDNKIIIDTHAYDVTIRRLIR